MAWQPDSWRTISLPMDNCTGPEDCVLHRSGHESLSNKLQERQRPCALAGRIAFVTVTFEPISDAHAHEGILTVVCFSNANNSK